MMVVMIAAATAAAMFDHGDQGRSRVYQHLSEETWDAECGCNQEGLCTHLPLVVIDTKGQEIPGVPTGERDSFNEEIYTLAEDGRSVIDVEISVIDNQTGNNHLTDSPAFTSKTEFRIRGHASRHFEKSPYKLNFVNEDGSNRDISVMGMDAHHEWILNGPYLDKSLVRNYIWYNIAGSMMEYAPDVRFCEVILDGDYRGLYLMAESITNGEDGRLNLMESVKDTNVSGYLVRIDRPNDEELNAVRNINSHAERMFYLRGDISIRYPGQANLTQELADKIERDLSEFEKALYSYDYDTHDYGYWNWIDVDNFIDYFLINELSRNVDAGRYSTYLYKEPGEKYKLCVWDFNNACDNFPDDQISPEGFAMHERLWYFMLFKDEEFVLKILDRYEELRKTWFSEEFLYGLIDDTIAWLGPAVERNNLRWAEYIENGDPLIPAERNVYSQEEAVDQLKDWLGRRIDWLDAHIDVLQQYSHPSRNKTYNH